LEINITSFRELSTIVRLLFAGLIFTGFAGRLAMADASIMVKKNV
jgi:hypothetical protein